MNKQDQTSFLLFGNWRPLFDFLSDSDAGVLIKKLFEFAETGETAKPEELSPSVSGPYFFMIDVMKQNADKWNDIKEKRRQAGKSGGLKSGEVRQANMKQNEANVKQIEANRSKINHTVNVNVNDNVNVINTKESIKKSASRFLPPTIEEVREYCNERNNKVSPEQFISFYESNGWLVGKNKMKDWKAAVRTWENRESFGNKKPSHNIKYVGKVAEPNEIEPKATDIFDLFDDKEQGGAI